MKKEIRPCVAVEGGGYRYANLYEADDFSLYSGSHTFRSLDEARAARSNAGHFVCCVKISTKVEIV